RLAALQALIEGIQSISRRIDRFARTGDRQMVAARHQGNAELLLDARQVLVVFAEQHREESVVIELQMGGWSHRKRWRLGHARISFAARAPDSMTWLPAVCDTPAATHPVRLCGSAVLISTSTSVPRRSGVAAT